MVRDSVRYADSPNLYLYVRARPSMYTDPTGRLSVCCRPMDTDTFYDYFINHCQLRNQCKPNETANDVWIDRTKGRVLDDGTPCATATTGDIEACLLRIPHSDQPRGGPPGQGDNCQVGALLRIGKCCLGSSWSPYTTVIGNRRGECLRGHWEYVSRFSVHGGPPYKYWVCDEYELPICLFRSRPKGAPKAAPRCPVIDDVSHGGFPEGGIPGFTYPK